jgi:hypothetical protein
MNPSSGEIEAHGAMVLAHLVEEWGIPFARKTIVNPERELSVYGFYDVAKGIVRLGTVGLSFRAFCKDWIGSELYVACFDSDPSDPNGFFTRGVDSLLSLAVHKEKYPLRFAAGEKIVSFTRVEPSAWTVSPHQAVLITEPVDEPVDFCKFSGSLLRFEVLWVVPIFESEVDIVRRVGTDSFFSSLEHAGKCELSLSRSALAESEVQS